MTVEAKGIAIYLEQEEIVDFWNIVMFALDLHNERTKENKSCMTESELKLANELAEITDKIK